MIHFTLLQKNEQRFGNNQKNPTFKSGSLLLKTDESLSLMMLRQAQHDKQQ